MVSIVDRYKSRLLSSFSVDEEIEYFSSSSTESLMKIMDSGSSTESIAAILNMYAHVHVWQPIDTASLGIKISPNKIIYQCINQCYCYSVGDIDS